MKSLVFERDLARFAAARVAGAIVPGRGASHGPLRLRRNDPPEPPAEDWVAVRPRLSGICGSDLATIDGHASRYFEPIVSFPFVPGHEIVGELDDGSRVVIESVLGCEARGIADQCPACAEGDVGGCRNVAFGHLEPGLQTGFCEDTGGGWSTVLRAHPSQLVPVPDEMSDEAAVMVEPTACALRGAFAVLESEPESVAVVGSGALGLLTIAALRALSPDTTVTASARYPDQRRLAAGMGADQVVGPDELIRSVRATTGSMRVGDHLTGGIDAVVDCVGSAESIEQAIAVARPKGTIVLTGMPGTVTLDLTGLWHKELHLRGAYAYGIEADGRRTFDHAMDLVTAADLGRLVSATYPLDRYREAVEHAAQAGPRGAVRIAFDLRDEKERDHL
jgi:threonine dehydrogenase-like Zn-dependent dehydrogenase